MLRFWPPAALHPIYSAPFFLARFGFPRETGGASGPRRDAAAQPALFARRRRGLWPGLWESCAAGQGPIRRMEPGARSEEHTSELQSLMRISYAVFCLKKKKNKNTHDQYKI